MEQFVSVGKILNFHGIKGELKIGYSKSQYEFLMSLKAVYLKCDTEYQKYNITSVKPHKSFLIVKLEGLDSINEVIPLKGHLLFVDELTIRKNLKEDEFLIDELVGSEVLDIKDNSILGFVVGVLNNGATDLISVKTHSKKVCLVPFVNAIVPTVDIKTKKIFINNIEGLIE